MVIVASRDLHATWFHGATSLATRKANVQCTEIHSSIKLSSYQAIKPSWRRPGGLGRLLSIYLSIYLYIYLIYRHAWCASCLSTPESPGMPVKCLATPSGQTASRVGLRESASAWCPFHIESASSVHTAWCVVSASSTLFTLSSMSSHRKEERLPKDPPRPGWKPTSDVSPSGSHDPRSVCRRRATSCLSLSMANERIVRPNWFLTRLADEGVIPARWGSPYFVGPRCVFVCVRVCCVCTLE